MSLTSPNSFSEFLKRIDEAGLKEKIWFFPIRQNEKKIECKRGTNPIEDVDFHMDRWQALKRLKFGGNIGIYALRGGLMFLDLDVANGKLLASEGILASLEGKTFSVRTRNGGLQYYFLNHPEYQNQEISENGQKIGELRSDNWYVVCCGSHVNPDKNGTQDATGTYKIFQNLPISKFEGLDGIVQRGVISEKKKTKERKQLEKGYIPSRTFSSSEYEQLLVSKHLYKRRMIKHGI